MSGETVNSNNEPNNQNQWDMSDVQANPETINEPSSFLEAENQRIAEITGRAPDDPEVTKMNLALRYQKYQQYKDLVENAEARHTMVQQGTLEDLATAKRELEAAMYAYDGAFEKSDAKAADIDRTEHIHNLKDQARADKHFGEGEAHTGNSWVQARLVRHEVYNGQRQQNANDRIAAAERLTAELPGIVSGVQQSEIYQTYELHKDQSPEAPIQDRRAGLEAGMNGLYNEDRKIDWALYPQPDIEATADEAPASPAEDGADAPGDADAAPDTTPDTDADTDADTSADTDVNTDTDTDVDTPNDTAAETGADQEKNPDDLMQEKKNLEDINRRAAELLGQDDETKDAEPDEDEDQDSEQAGEGSEDAPETKEQEDDPNIDGIIGEAERKIDQEKTERIKDLEARLDDLRPDLAELYAKNRRLVVGSKHKADFNKLKGQYGQLLDEYLRLKSETSFDAGKAEIAKNLQNKFNEMKETIEGEVTKFAGGDLNNSDKSPEEIESERKRLVKVAADSIKKEWLDQNAELKDQVNAEFIEDFINEQNLIEDETIDSLDNGTAARKVVSKVIANKKLKTVLAAAAVAGLAVTGAGLVAGLAAGSVAVAPVFGMGTALGVLKGGATGALMSRQSSANSAVRDLASENEIRNNLKNIDVLNNGGDVANATDWLLDQYEAAKDADLSSNRKRTAISAGIGAAIGGVMGSIQFGPASAPDTTTPSTPVDAPVDGGTPQITGYDVSANMSNVNVPEGGGVSYTFTQAGGDPAQLEKAVEIMHNVDASYGLSPGSNGVNAGFDGLVGQFAHTYPGTIDGWPDVAQDYIRTVMEEWAKNGLIQGVPVYSVDTAGSAAVEAVASTATTEAVSDSFTTLLDIATQWVSPIAASGAAAAAVAGRQNRADSVAAPQITPPQPETPAPNAGNSGAVDPNAPTMPIGSQSPAPTPGANSAPEPSGTQGATPDVTPETEPSTPETPPQTPPEPELRSDSPAEPQEPATPAEEPETASDASTDQSETEPQDDFSEAARQQLSNVLDAEGLEIVTMANRDPAQYSENSARIEAWWNGLGDDTKTAVLQFEQDNNHPRISGAALRLWLQRQGLLSTPTAA